MKTVIGQQGEVPFAILPCLPNVAMKRVKRSPAGFIISHSESGHHHILTGGDVMERTEGVPAGMQIFYAILDAPEHLIQDAPGAHEAVRLPTGIIEFKISRTYNPFLDEARRVAD
jgi:hypothetical protein